MGRVVRSGGLVAFPTDTVYGVGADASNPEAVRRLYAAKDRPRDKALPVLLADVGDITRYALEIPGSAWILAERFWPGPLTMVLCRTDAICSEAAGGGHTVGLRLPDREMARSVVRASGVPLAVTSANASGGRATVDGTEVLRSLGPCLGALVESSCPGSGIPSTVVDLTVTPPRLVREGGIAAEDVADALGEPLGKEQQA